MMTIEEKTAIAKLGRFREDFIKGVEILVRLEAMKVANKMCLEKGENLKYGEDDFLAILNK